MDSDLIIFRCDLEKLFGSHSIHEAGSAASASPCWPATYSGNNSSGEDHNFGGEFNSFVVEGGQPGRGRDIGRVRWRWWWPGKI